MTDGLMIAGNVGNQTGTAASPLDARLGPRADNGGATQTHALLPGSLAIDSGDPNFTAPPDFDQRCAPFVRVAHDQIDVGAFEVQAAQSADFVDNDSIDGANLLAWQRGFGTTTGATRADGDADNDGDVDAIDLAEWEATFGQSEPGQSAAAVSDQPAAAIASSAELIDAAMALEWTRDNYGAETSAVAELQPVATVSSVGNAPAALAQTLDTSSEVDAVRSVDSCDKDEEGLPAGSRTNR